MGGRALGRLIGGCLGRGLLAAGKAEGYENKAKQKVFH